MEFKKVLIDNMYVIVRQIYNKDPDISDKEFLDNTFTIVINNIDINIDSQKLYFLEYSKLDTNCIYFEYLDYPIKPILKEIVNIISNKMCEHIKNKHHRIHFRVFKDNVYMEDEQNSIRTSFFKYCTCFLNDSGSIFKYFVHKLLHYENIIREKSDDINPKKKIEYLVIMDRIKKIISALAECIDQ